MSFSCHTCSTSGVYAYQVAITSSTLLPKNFANIFGRPDADLWRQVYFDGISSLQATGHKNVVERPFGCRIILILEILPAKRDGVLRLWKPNAKLWLVEICSSPLRHTLLLSRALRLCADSFCSPFDILHPYTNLMSKLPFYVADFVN